MSGFFQGYAEMISPVGWRRDNVWGQGTGGKNPWGRSFKVKWLRLCDLPFQETLHLKNPLNDFKPVKISRDCQELPEDIGISLCKLLDGKDEKNTNLVRADIPSERPSSEPACGLQDQGCDTSALHLAWAQPPILYPSLLYQCQAESSQLHSPHLPMTFGAPTVSSMKPSQVNGTLTSANWNHDRSSPLDVWGWSADRSPLASTLTDDDILDMSYEEYLEVHSRGKRLHPPVAGSSRPTREATSTEHSDDSYSRGRSHKRSRRSSSDK